MNFWNIKLVHCSVNLTPENGGSICFSCNLIGTMVFLLLQIMIFLNNLFEKFFFTF